MTDKGIRNINDAIPVIGPDRNLRRKFLPSQFSVTLNSFSAQISIEQILVKWKFSLESPKKCGSCVSEVK